MFFTPCARDKRNLHVHPQEGLRKLLYKRVDNDNLFSNTCTCNYAILYRRPSNCPFEPGTSGLALCVFSACMQAILKQMKMIPLTSQMDQYKVELNLLSSTKDKGDNKYMDEGTQYIMCSQCKSSLRLRRRGIWHEGT